MNPINKKVSIVIATRDKAIFLKEAIESCLAQSHCDIEVLIVDDASRDDTRNVVNTCSDARIRYIRHGLPMGVSKSLNDGFSQATGEYFLRLGDTERLLPRALEEMLKCLHSHPPSECIYMNYYARNVKTHYQSLKELPDYVNSPNFNRTIPCLLFSRLAYQAVGGYDSQFEPVEQFEFCLRMIKKFELKHCLQALAVLLSGPNVKERTLPVKQGLLRHVVRYKRGYTEKISFIQATENFFRELRLLSRGRSDYTLALVQVFRMIIKMSWRAGFVFAFLVVKMLLIRPFLTTISNGISKIISNIIASVIKLISLVPSMPPMPKMATPDPKDLWRRFKILLIKKMAQKYTNTTRVLCLIPQMVVGGSEKVVGDIVGGLRTKGYTFFLLGAKKENNKWCKHFSDLFAGIILLPEQFVNIYHSSQEVYFAHVADMIRILDIKMVLISNPEHGYNILPQLKEEFPWVKVVDLIHLEQYAATTDTLRWVAPYIDRRVCISQRLRNVMLSQYKKENFKSNYEPRMVCIYNGNDMKQFDPDQLQKGKFKKRRGLNPDAKIVSVVARMAWIKRPLLFVEAAKALVDKGLADPMVFVMAGDGEDTKFVKEKVQDYGLQDKFILTGMIPQNEVRELLADSYLFLLVSELEGLALVAVEAMSMSVPVIATDVGAMNEAIEHGKNGFLVHAHKNVVGDVTAIVEKLVKDPALYERIARESRRSVLAKFSLDTMIENYGRLFEETLQLEPQKPESDPSFSAQRSSSAPSLFSKLNLPRLAQQGGHVK